VNPEFVALLRPYLKYAGDRDISGESRLRDLGLDSRLAIELLFAVEDAYGVVIPDERLTDATFETCRSLWSVVEELRA
jgi:acyl carrier protein